MTKRPIGSVARTARAALKEALGAVTGDRALEAEGAAERAAARRDLGDGRSQTGAAGTRDAR